MDNAEAILETVRRALGAVCPKCGRREGNGCLTDVDGILIHAERIAYSKQRVFIAPKPVDLEEHHRAVMANRDRILQPEVRRPRTPGFQIPVSALLNDEPGQPPEVADRSSAAYQ